MKINKKVFFGITISLLISATAVYASTSADFLTKANKYINSNCNNRRIDNQTSLNCYLFYKLGELGTQVNSNTSRIAALEHAPTPTPTSSPVPSASPFVHKELRTFDANGVELGLFTDRQSFFFVPLGVIVTLDDDLIRPRQDAWFISSNCTGQAYGLMSDRDHWRLAYALFAIGPGKYYTVNNNASITTTFNSFLRYDGSAVICTVSSASEKAWPITEVTVPFSEPLALPLQFKYQ